MPAVVRVSVAEAKVNTGILDPLTTNETRNAVGRALIGDLLRWPDEVSVHEELDLVAPRRAALPVSPLVACALAVLGDPSVLLTVKLADEVVAIGVLGLVLSVARGLRVGLTVDLPGHIGCASWLRCVILVGVYTPVGELPTIFKLLGLKLDHSVSALDQLAVALDEPPSRFTGQGSGNGTGDGEEKHRDLAEMHS